MSEADLADVAPEWRRAFATVGKLVGGRVVRAERQPRWRPAWFLDVECDGASVPVYFRGDRGATDHGVYPLEHELLVLERLEANGIPVPHVYGFCDEPRGIVMQRVPGRANLASASSDEERRAVLDAYVDILAQMHQIPLERFDGAGLPRPQDARALALGDLPRWEAVYRARARRPEPRIEFVLGWLRRNVPAGRTRVALVAGDSGQFLFERGRVTAILDLELAHFGDPLADLAGMRCRDLSEPLGDLSRAFRRYAEQSGEALDLRALDYHTIRFGIVTPLAVEPLCADPPPGFDLVQYLGWNWVYGRVPLERIASLIGVALEAPLLPEPETSPHAVAHDVLVEQLGRDGRSYELDVALRIAQYAREVDRRGARLEAEDLEEAAALVERRLADWREADAALQALVRAAGPERDADLVRFFWRRTLRREALLRPALRELAHASLQRISV